MIRGRSAVAVFAGAGVRIGEVISLRVNDVEARDRSPWLRVYGKGGRKRVVPVGPEVIEAVDAYLESRRDRLGPYKATGELFVRADGRPFSRGTLDYLVSTWFRRAGVAPPPGSLAPTPGPSSASPTPTASDTRCFITDLSDADVAYLEAPQRGRGRAEKLICDLKATGLSNLPSAEFAINEAWVTVALMAHDLLAWTRLVALEGA